MSASDNSQSMAGVVERLVRPMLVKTLTEEVQPFFCGINDVNVSLLTPFARMWIARYEHMLDAGAVVDRYRNMSNARDLGPAALLISTTA